MCLSGPAAGVAVDDCAIIWVAPQAAPALSSADITAAMKTAESSPLLLDSMSGGLITSLKLVQPVTRAGTCGNGVCEVEEPCEADDDQDCCRGDCPTVFLTCPGPPDGVRTSAYLPNLCLPRSSCSHPRLDSKNDF